MSTRCSEPQRFVCDAIPNPETTLLVRGSSHDGAIIRLEGKVVTIGSSPNVKLRLLAKGVKPIHAMLIRGRARTVYRAYDGEVTVNGIPTSEGVISPGDLLGIGPVRLVFMPSEAERTSGESEETARCEENLKEQSCSPLNVASSQQGGNISLTRASREDGPEPAFLDGPTSAASTDSICNDVNSIPAQLSATPLPAIMAGMVTAVTEFQAEVRTEIERLKEAIAELQTKLSNWEEKTEERFEELRQTVPQWKSLLEETRRQQSMAEDMFLHVRAELERLHRMETEIVRRQIDLATEQTKLDTKAAMLVTREAVLPCSTALPKEVSCTSPGENDADRGNSGSQVVGTAVGAVRPKGDGTTGIFAQGSVGVRQTDTSPPPEGLTQSDSSWKQGPREDATAATISQQNEPEPVEALADDARAVHEHAASETAPQIGSRSTDSQKIPDDPADANRESNLEHQRVVQEYLARLLRRSTGNGPAEGTISEGTETIASPEQSGTSTTPAGEEKGTASRRIAGVSRQRRLTRRSAGAPEKTKDFAAMRELANLSSQAAIDRYAKVKLRQIRQEKTIVLLVASLCGAALVVLHAWTGLGPLGWIALALVFLVILVYGMQYGLLTGRLIINSKGQLQLAERRIGREMRKLIPSSKPALLEADEARPDYSTEPDSPSGKGM